MDPFEKQLLDSLTQSLVDKQRLINSRLKDVKKCGSKLNKVLQKKQKKQNNTHDEETTDFLIRQKKKIETQIELKTQLEQKLNIVELKILEITGHRPD